MSNKILNVGVLVTGLFRNKLEFSLLFESISKLKESLEIKEIVLVTWDSEIPSSIIYLLKDHGVNILELSQSPLSGFTNIFHQYRAIYHGLQYLNGCDYVLKLRTDFNSNLNILSSVLDSNFATQSKSDNLQVFDEKVYVGSASLINTMRAEDLNFFMSLNDANKIFCNEAYFDCLPLSEHKSIGAEFRWISLPFLKSSKFITSIFNSFDYRAISKRIIECIQEGRVKEIPDVLIKYMSLNLIWIKSNFILMGVNRDTGVFQLENALLGNLPQVGRLQEVQGGWDFRFVNQFAVDKIFAGEIVESELSIRLLEIIKAYSHGLDIKDKPISSYEFDDISVFLGIKSPTFTYRFHGRTVKEVTSIEPTTILSESGADALVRILELTELQRSEGHTKLSTLIPLALDSLVLQGRVDEAVEVICLLNNEELIDNKLKRSLTALMKNKDKSYLELAKKIESI